MKGLLDSSDSRDLRAIIDLLGMAAFVVDVDPDGAFRLAAINTRHEQYSGMRHDEVAGRRPEEFLPPDTAAVVTENYRRCVEQRAAIDYREGLELHPGPTYWHTTLVPFFDDTGRVFRILGTSLEISETVHLELEARYQSTLLSAYLEESPDGILVGDAENHVKTWNRRFLEIWGLPEEVMAAGDGARALEIVRPQVVDPDEFVTRVLQLYERLDEEEHGHRIAMRDGRILERFSRGLQDQQGAHWGRIWFYRDITQQLADAEALRRSEARLRATVESAADAIVTVNEGGWIEGFNPAAERIFGYRADEVIGGDVSPLLPQELAARHHEWLSRYVSGGRATVMGQGRELFGRRKDGSLFPIEITLTDTGNASPRLIIAIIRDITERKAMEEELRRLARSDPLTGVYNRRAFMEAFSEEARRARRYTHPLTVLMLDLDHFKRINDEYGHEVGDAALRTFVAVVPPLLRAGDPFGRLGGEEFGILLPETPLARARLIAERVRGAVEAARVECGGHRFGITVSIGASEVRPGGGDMERALARADRALYAAKEGGRNRVEVG